VLLHLDRFDELNGGKMAYNETLADRIRGALANQPDITEKKMFGGLAFMLNGNMVCGVTKDDLMLRVGAENYADALKQPGAREMDFNGRPMKGMVFVNGSEITDNDIAERVNACARFASSLPSK
jgi:TfoX/Sxy family transcriptional regulator of competence genes